jgi:pimeloyl-ACP methyl ester carboxylesterase
MLQASELLHDFGGRGLTVHLAHANGFPPGTYRLLADALTDAYHVIGLPARPLWPGSDPAKAPDWRPLADDLVHALHDLSLSGIVGVGHSLGGVLTLWAGSDQPDLFRAVILIEPVILPPTWLYCLRLMRWLGLGNRQPLVQSALRRRRAWSSHEECFVHFRQKTFFGRWSDDALWDYVKSSTCRREDHSVALCYPPEWEAHIFATAPADIWRDVPRLQIPALVLRGEHSRTFLPSAQARLTRLLPQARSVTVPDSGHLVPMERPSETAHLILEFLADCTPGPGGL